MKEVDDALTVIRYLYQTIDDKIKQHKPPILTSPIASELKEIYNQLINIHHELSSSRYILPLLAKTAKDEMNRQLVVSEDDRTSHFSHIIIYFFENNHKELKRHVSDVKESLTTFLEHLPKESTKGAAPK